MKKVVYPVAALFLSVAVLVPQNGWAQDALSGEYIGSGQPLALGPDAVFIPIPSTRPMPEPVANTLLDDAPCEGDCGGASARALPAPQASRSLVAVPQTIDELRGVGVPGIGWLQVGLDYPVLYAGVTFFGFKPDSAQVTIYRKSQAIISCGLSFLNSATADGSSGAEALLIDGKMVVGACDTDLSQPGQQVGAINAAAGDDVQFSYSVAEQQGVVFYSAQLFERTDWLPGSSTSAAVVSSKAQGASQSVKGGQKPTSNKKKQLKKKKKPSPRKPAPKKPGPKKPGPRQPPQDPGVPEPWRE